MICLIRTFIWVNFLLIFILKTKFCVKRLAASRDVSCHEQSAVTLNSFDLPRNSTQSQTIQVDWWSWISSSNLCSMEVSSSSSFDRREKLCNSQSAHKKPPNSQGRSDLMVKLANNMIWIYVNLPNHWPNAYNNTHYQPESSLGLLTYFPTTTEWVQIDFGWRNLFEQFRV